MTEGAQAPFVFARARRHFAQNSAVRAVLVCATFHIDFLEFMWYYIGVKGRKKG